MASIKNIVFDIGNVLIRVDTEAPIDFLQGVAKQSTAHGSGSAELLELIDSFEAGVISEMLFFAAWQKLEGGQFTVADLKKAWLTVLKEPVFEQEEPIRALKGNYQLAILSNTNSVHSAEFEKSAFPILRHFKHRYYSYKIGYTKPQLHAFAYVLKEMNFTPKETLMIDDRPENIEAAEELGMKGLFLGKPDQLESELKSWGLI